ncbi:hypothetical protein Gotri_014884 [Gossypium trilobum]|uniref:DUF4283 domain-containing protein n=1 Tax=Gossypium trilobum TaxID=34281 RepID=A0A7J9DYF9_9ROSI|nr:hypothetical protein [Gossypium trilobum]
MVDDLANLRLSNEEEDAFQEDAKEMERDIKFSLVETCLTNSVLHFSSFRNTIADLWHPIGGITITNIGEKRYSFKFFHTVDMNKVLKGLPWFFNNHLLLHKRKMKEDPLTVLLNYVVFWIQIHDLPSGLMLETMAKHFGVFMEYDMRILSLRLLWYMRIKVRLDVRLAPKLREKVQVGDQPYYARFQYEKLSLFCFIYGKLGHGKSFCPVMVRVDPSKIVFGWDTALRATIKGGPVRINHWLRQPDGMDFRYADKEMMRSWPHHVSIQLNDLRIGLSSRGPSAK